MTVVNCVRLSPRLDDGVTPGELVSAYRPHWQPSSPPPTQTVSITENEIALSRDPRRVGLHDRFDLIVVPETAEWLLPIITPLAAKCRDTGLLPIVFAAADSTNRPMERLIERLSPARSLVYFSSDDFAVDLRGLKGTQQIQMSDDPFEAGVLTAKEFWGTSDTIVLAPFEDKKAMLMGGALAGLLRAPFLPVDPLDTSGQRIGAVLDDMAVQTTLVAVSSRYGPLSWTNELKRRVLLLDTPAVHSYCVRLIGQDNVKNIVLAPVSDEMQEQSPSWLAPYLCAAHNSLLIPISSASGIDAEDEAWKAVTDYGLHPRTATILADYESLGWITVTDARTLGEYEVNVEPCARSPEKHAAPLGVGRIPSSGLSHASVFIARGLARDRIVGKKRRSHALMMANPMTPYSSLPLCETIARATSAELRNFGVRVHDFYNGSAADPNAFAAAINADMIIFQGHVYDIRFFEGEQFPLPEIYESSMFLAEDQSSNGVPQYAPESPVMLCSLWNESRAAQGSVSSATYEGLRSETVDQDSYSEIEPPLEDIPIQVTFHDPLTNSIKPLRVLHGLPLVILQSCHSLDEPVARQCIEADALGVLGTSASVHSASGSAFVKAFLDGMLYRRDTVGEALRDARNYFLCLAELKADRGHREQTKVTRASLAFCYWGDPELKLANFPPRRPKLSPVSAKFTQAHKLEIRTPGKRLATQRTDEYFVRLFPGSELAGIVKRLKKKTERRVMPTYFFRLDMPPSSGTNEYLQVVHNGDTSTRSRCLRDPFQRFVYVLYLPDKPVKNESYIVEFQP